MTRRIIAVVGIFAAGVVGGLTIEKALEAPPCGSAAGCFDRFAAEQCSKAPGRNSLRKRSVSLPKVEGVQDWVFMAHCDGAPQAKIKISTVEPTI